MKAIDEVVPPTNLKELQSLLGKINFVRRFISNLSQKVLLFSPLLMIKKDQKFHGVTNNKRLSMRSSST
jgi:hypothetical protein